MAFRGPSQAYDRLGLEAALARGGNPYQTGGTPATEVRYGPIDTSLLQQQAQDEAAQARLLMTPGVMRGGSTRTRSVADSPLMQGSSQNFTLGGQSFSYDPDLAAETQGRAEGTAQSEAQRQRYESYQKIPGITARQAARIVYGRSGVVDEEQEVQQLRQAQADYVRQPDRFMAARAVEFGASPSQYPDRFASVERSPTGRGEMSSRTQQMIEEAPLERQRFQEDEAVRAGYREQERGRMDALNTERENRLAQQERRRVVMARPRPNQYLNPTTKLLDEPAYQRALQDWQGQMDLMGGGPVPMPQAPTQSSGTSSPPLVASPQAPPSSNVETVRAALKSGKVTAADVQASTKLTAAEKAAILQGME